VSTRHNERIRRLVAWMRTHALTRAPLMVFHSPALPITPPEEIAAARTDGRRVVNVYFVEPPPSGGNDSVGEALNSAPCTDSQPAQRGNAKAGNDPVTQNPLLRRKNDEV
jgi:hypothetical protein